MMALDLQGVHSGYGAIKVLHDITLSVADGAILGVLGRNGMGKTTLINTIAGVVPAMAGSIRLDGRDMTRVPVHRRARLGITTVVQGRGMFAQMTVRENLEMGRIAGGGAKRSRIDEVVGYFPRLGERMHQQAGTLSGGEQQMLAIGRGLMTDPKVMLLDEPSDGVMPILVQQIAENLVEINRREGMTLVVVEQNVPMVLQMTDHCVIIEKGRIVAEGNRQQISDSEVMRAYLAI
ncbi:MAG: ABC transporter ATP-binding protein [Rhodospirillaceae bacterium]|nr:ABC transporter ATP-binding protein [Rhodospirillaceae bacterium]